MSAFALAVSVHEGSNDGPPVANAHVTGILNGARTNAQGVAVVTGVYLSVDAEGYISYIGQLFERPSLDAPITVSLQRSR